jgi:hypothetical protein
MDAVIDAKAEALKAETPGVPLPVLRNLLTNRAFGCQCQAVLNLEVFGFDDRAPNTGKINARGDKRLDIGDLAVVVGGYDATATGGAEHGTFVRVWKRDVTGRWRIVFETTKKRN